jgi:AraC family transcriptional regulator of adaptative response / DNA-3-methyladenine glycosylase II
MAAARCDDCSILMPTPWWSLTLLSRDEALSGLVAARPGLPSPGAVDGFELAVRTVIGQQTSVASATNGLQRILVQNDLPTIPGTGLFEFPWRTPRRGLPKRRARGTLRG